MYVAFKKGGRNAAEWERNTGKGLLENEKKTSRNGSSGIADEGRGEWEMPLKMLKVDKYGRKLEAGEKGWILLTLLGMCVHTTEDVIRTWS